MAFTFADKILDFYCAAAKLCIEIDGRRIWGKERMMRSAMGGSRRKAFGRCDSLSTS